MVRQQQDHDPADLEAARAFVVREDKTPIGLLYCSPENPRYDHESAEGIGMDTSSKLKRVQAEIDLHLI